MLEHILKDPLRYPDRREVDALVNEAMKHLPADRTDLYSRVSHAVRTPLAAILGFREVLDLDKKLTESERASYQEIIGAETWRLQRFLESLQVLRDILAGNLVLRTARSDLSSTVSEAVSRCSLEARTKKVRIELIPLPDGTTIEADHPRVRLAIEHLLFNAIRATPKEGIISVEVIDRGKIVETIVEDHGHGMDPAQVDALLQPFNRIQRADDNGGEMGIGLTIARSVAEGHRGRLSIASVPTEGTQVTITLLR